MSFEEFMTKIRHWDNYYARWMMRHFYILFFEIVLVVIFFLFFFNIFRLIDLTADIPRDKTLEQLLLQQTTNINIIVVLLLLNSFWMLYIFNGINRLRIVLKDIHFALIRRRQRDHAPAPQPPKDEDVNW